MAVKTNFNMEELAIQVAVHADNERLKEVSLQAWTIYSQLFPFPAV